jgi:hypothetical protein
VARKPEKLSVQDRVLEAIRSSVGAEASVEACAVVLAAAAPCGRTTAHKVFSGHGVSPRIARRIAAAVAKWGYEIPAGDIAMGDHP